MPGGRLFLWIVIRILWFGIVLIVVSSFLQWNSWPDLLSIRLLDQPNFAIDFE